MMHYFKKIALSLVISGLILSPVASFSYYNPGGDGSFPTNSGYTSFNTSSQDYSTLLVSNHSQNPGSSTNWSGSVQNVHAGDVVSFRFYYHNTGTVTAQDTRAAISFSYSQTGMSANGKLWASNAAPVYGTAYISLASGVKNPSLSFNSAVWYPNHNTSNSQPLPYGQNGSEVASANGVALGNIAPGGDTQGYLVVRFTVNGSITGGDTHQFNNAQCVAVNAPSSVNAGQSFTASVNMSNNGSKTWTSEYRLGSQNPQDNLNWGISRVYLPGHWVYPGGSALFTFTATAPVTAGTYAFDWKMVQEGVQWFGATCTKTITVTSVTSQNNPDFAVSVSPSSQTISKPGQRTYTVYTSVVSGNPSQISLSFIPNGNDISGYFAEPVIQAGNTTTLSVSVGSNAPDGVVNMIVRGASDGKTHDAPVAVNITSPASQATLTLTPNSSAIQTGQTQQFFAMYDADGPNGGLAAQDVTGSANWSSSQPNVASFYSNGQFYGNNAGFTNISATYNGITANATLTVNQNNSQPQGGAPIVATNPAINVLDNSATLSGQVNPNNSQTTYHFEYGTSYAFGSSTSFNSAGSGNTNQFVLYALGGLVPNTTYYFRVVAQNGYGTSYGSILSFTTSASQPAPVVQLPYVVTNDALYITKTSALMNSSVKPSANTGTVWFEYGATTALGNTTLTQPTSGDVLANYSYVLINLAPDTTYYFRVAASNQFGTAYGSLLSFHTNATEVTVTPAPAPAPIVITNVVAGSQCVSLLPAVSSPAVKTGEEFNYSVTYRNNCSFDLANVTLSVVLPQGATLLESNIPFSVTDPDTRVISLGVVPKEFQGTVIFRTKLANLTGKDGTVLYGATMNYLDAKNRSQSVSAYLSVAVTAVGLIGLASVLALLSGLSWAWLLVLLLVALSIYLYYKNKKQGV